jgi:flagellar motor switch/type III secretory pathway protein FliN
MMAGTELMARKTEIVGLETSGLQAEITPAISWMTRIEEHPSWEVLAQLQVTMRVGVALSHFKVRDLLALKSGQVFSSILSATEDVPLMVGQVQLGWSEFEVQEQRMALRLTRLG